MIKKRKRAKRGAPLEPWQRKDAGRLKDLFEKYRAAGGLSQEAFGERFEIGNQSAVSQYLNGLIALNLASATKFARGMGLAVADISPTLANELGKEAGMFQADMLGAIRLLRREEREDAIQYLLGRMKRSGVAAQVVAHYEVQLSNMLRQLELDFGDKADKQK